MEGRPLALDLTEVGIVEPLELPAEVEVLLVRNLLRVPDRLVVEPLSIQDVPDLLFGLVLSPLLEGRVNLILTLGLDPLIPRRVLLLQILPPDESHQLGEVGIGIRADQDESLFQLLRVFGVRIGRLAALDDPVDTQEGVPVAPPLGHQAVAAVEGDAVGEVPLGSLDLRVLHEAPEAGDIVAPVHARQDLEGGHHPAPVVHDPDRLLRGEASLIQWPASHREAAALGLTQDVVAGPLPAGAPAAEAAEPLVDEPGVDLAQLPVTDPPAVEGAGSVVFHDAVAFSGQHPDNFLSF